MENSIKVECQECGKKFSTKSMIPECPNCGGSDIDLATAKAKPIMYFITVTPERAAELIKTTWNTTMDCVKYASERGMNIRIGYVKENGKRKFKSFLPVNPQTV